MKKKYFAPEIKITYVDADIITYSETEEWNGPMIEVDDGEGENA